MITYLRFLWTEAQETERRHLAHVYRRASRIPIDVQEHVQAALLLEILEEQDHRSWPDDYQLSGIQWELQYLVLRTCEMHSVDRRQRESYMRLLMASKGRHLDVAHGLSECLVWGHQQNVVDKLIAMGKRNYHAPVPTDHVMENGVLHVAVSYKHTSTFYDKGTISLQQAQAIWHSVNSIFFVEQHTEVRVWVDQNLHRSQFSAARKWHEFGLLPYACLKTVFVGDGDFSVRLARTRPWLWVEMITALKTEGIYTKPGQDIVMRSDGTLEKTEIYDQRKEIMLRHGLLMGAEQNVDDVMYTITRIISLWRREFLDHFNYPWADEFEEFVNWCRRFVIRNVPYSEMEWHHSSEPVCGMDAVVLVRALPSYRLAIDTGLVRPAIYWRAESENEDWILGHIIDRSLVGELPLHELLEIKREGFQQGEALTVYGRASSLDRVRFIKHDDVVSMATTDHASEMIFSKFTLTIKSVMDAYKTSLKRVVLTLPKYSQAFMSYKPFTHQVFVVRQGALEVGDACLRPAAVSASVEEDLQLEKIGICHNLGICEQVYAIDVNGRKRLFSANEITVVLAACKNNALRFRKMANSLKAFCSYKLMRFKDMKDREILSCTRGKRMDNVEGTCLVSDCFVSGVPEIDIEGELLDIIRHENPDCTLITIDAIFRGHVRVIFRGSHEKTILLARQLGTSRGMAIVRETNREKLVNVGSTGLIEMAVGIQPKIRVKEYGSGLNPIIRTQEDGKEVEILAVDGLFSTCMFCKDEVCNLNGLLASIHEESQMVLLQWRGRHTCVGHDYKEFIVTSGSRIV